MIYFDKYMFQQSTRILGIKRVTRKVIPMIFWRFHTKTANGANHIMTAGAEIYGCLRIPYRFSPTRTGSTFSSE